jgi:hypothetical protein
VKLLAKRALLVSESQQPEPKGALGSRQEVSRMQETQGPGQETEQEPGTEQTPDPTPAPEEETGEDGDEQAS